MRRARHENGRRHAKTALSSEPVNVFIADSRGGHHPGEFENRREYMPKWTPAELSDAELRLIFAYIDSL